MNHNKSCIISFPGTNYPPILLDKHSLLSQDLTVQNSPVLFGCCTGICGTCLVVVKGNISSPNQEEQELLDILAPGNNQVRLACQLDLTSDLEIMALTDC